MTDFRNIQPYPPGRGEGSFLLRLLVLLALAAAVGFFASRWIERGRHAAQPRGITPRGDLADAEKTNIAIFKQANPSVVFITTLGAVEDVYGQDTSQVRQGTGSGIVWDDGGDIVTNFHVVQDASSAQVTLWDHSSYPATLVGVTRDNDLAVIRINAPKEKLHPIPVGQSANLQVGQMTFAIGDPFGLDQSLTTGIISALGRTINSVVNTPIEDVIQTQAPINPGNSGGPLLDSAGRLIGVNTAILSPSGASAGIGFAIPVDQVNRIVPQLIASGRITRPSLGLRFIDSLSQQYPQELGVNGILIASVRPNSPASVAGLRGIRQLNDGRFVPGDILQAIDGHPINSPNELFARLERYKTGDTVQLTILRDAKSMQVPVQLAAPSNGQG